MCGSSMEVDGQVCMVEVGMWNIIVTPSERDSGTEVCKTGEKRMHR